MAGNNIRSRAHFPDKRSKPHTQCFYTCQIEFGFGIVMKDAQTTSAHHIREIRSP